MATSLVPKARWLTRWRRAVEVRSLRTSAVVNGPTSVCVAKLPGLLRKEGGHCHVTDRAR